MHKASIGIDMDGVLADLDSAFYEYTNTKHPNKQEGYSSRTEFFDDFLPSFTKNDGFFIQGTLIKSKELITFLLGLKANLFILTSAGQFHHPISDVVSQKKRWIEKNFPELSLIPFVATTSGASKSVFANQSTILIDDHENNIAKFNDCGGHGILYSPDNIEDVKKLVKEKVDLINEN